VRFFDHDRFRKLEARLRAERPEPSAELVRSIVDRAGPVYKGRPLRLVFAMVTAAAVAGLAYVGGVSYASSSVGGAATSAWNVVNFKDNSKSAVTHTTAATKTRNNNNNGDDDECDDDDDSAADCEYEDDDNGTCEDDENGRHDDAVTFEDQRHQDALAQISLIQDANARKAAEKQENKKHKQNQNGENKTHTQNLADCT
jgi:hypothetical protein